MTRTIVLKVVPFSEPWEFGFGAWAFTEGDVVTIRSPAHLRILGGLGRVAHEINHAADENFGNDDHHSHGLEPMLSCIRGKAIVRTWSHSESCSKKQALSLLTNRKLEIT